MFNKLIVYEALKNCQPRDSHPEEHRLTPDEQASLISLLIHDIFGAEILKTHLKKGWHFYNRIEGKRIDFTSSDINNNADETNFEDIPSTPDETYSYFEDEEYSTFLMRFIRAFEEAVGLDNYRPEAAAS
ncbi:MAG: hypothetical protein IPN67_08010 [Bacteroidales bacterium]|nr:hypothetical protein [Bacteroidales bacterium]